MIAPLILASQTLLSLTNPSDVIQYIEQPGCNRIQQERNKLRFEFQPWTDGFSLKYKNMQLIKIKINAPIGCRITHVIDGMSSFGLIFNGPKSPA